MKRVFLTLVAGLLLTPCLNHNWLYAGEEAESSTADISDAMQTSATLEGIYPLKKGMKVSGPALTVRTAPGDWARPVEAIEFAREGQVLVVDASGIGPAVWGELATSSAMARKLAGIVVNGAVRDIEGISHLGFPVFAKSAMPDAGEPKGFGEIGVAVKIGDVIVRSGDWIVGDDNGVVCIPKERADGVRTRAKIIAEQKKRIKDRMAKGSTLARQLARDRLIKDVKALQAQIRNLERIDPRDKNQEQALMLMRNHYNAITQRFPDGVVMTTMEGNILDCNKAYQDMLGYTLDELKHITYQQLTPEKWHDTEREFVSMALKEGYVYFEKEYIKKDGTTFPIAITGWVIKDSQGKPIGTGSFVEEVSKSRE